MLGRRITSGSAVSLRPSARRELVQSVIFTDFTELRIDSYHVVHKLRQDEKGYKHGSSFEVIMNF